MTREYNLQCVYLYYPVLKQHIQYEFEPCDNDPIEKITAEHSSAVVTLSKEAKRWATKIGRENNSIKENNKKLQTLLALRDSGQKVKKVHSYMVCSKWKRTRGTEALIVFAGRSKRSQWT